MALFSNDENGRRTSSNLSTVAQNFEEDLAIEPEVSNSGADINYFLTGWNRFNPVIFVLDKKIFLTEHHSLEEHSFSIF